jgi:alpha-2-macroglobulin
MRHTRLLLALLLVSSAAAAQPPSGADTQPAFSLYSSHIATTRERPAIELMFRRVSSLDFRVYRVQEPVRFFAGLREPHQLGSEAPVVPQEQTILERVARWKADWRDAIRSFFRRQFSHQYRAARREAAARKQIALRQPLRYNQFAQVPLLNAAGLVASWREMLPPVRETEVRRIPLDLPGPGVYVVEAVAAPFKAYTIVIVSDLGLVTKAAPGQLLMFAANRFTGEPAGGCEAGVVMKQAVLARGTADADGVFEATLAEKAEDVIAIATCGNQVAATDPGGWYFEDALRRLIAYVYTDKPIYRPGHVVHLKGVLRWRGPSGLQPFDRKQVEVTITDPNSKVVHRQTAGIDEFGSMLVTFPVPAGAALGFYNVQVTSDDQEAGGHFEVEEYRKPDFEVIVRPAERFVLQGGRAVARVSARYYFGQPVANAAVKYVVHRQPYFSPIRWAEDEDEERPQWWFGGDEERQGTIRLDGQGQGDIAVPLDVEEQGRDYSIRIEARVIDASSREVPGNTIVHATHGKFLLVARSDYVAAGGSETTLSVRAVDYAGNPQANVSLATAVERVTWGSGDSRQATKLSTGTAVTDAEGLATWKARVPTQPGSYELTVEASSEGRTVRDSAWVWVPGRAEGVEAGERELELVADRKTYQPGDVARVNIRGEVAPTAVLVTKEGQQVSWRRVVRPAAGAAIDVPIDDADIGDVYVNVAFLKDDRLYRAEKRLKVPAAARQLQVTVSPDQPVARPGQPGQFTVRVVSAAGQPVRAQVSLGVIDEAVYGVKPDQTVDPLRFFYRREYSRVGTQFSREYTFVGYSGSQRLMLAQRRRPLSLADFKGDRPAQPQVRKEFPDAIFWIGNLVTGGDGTAKVQVRYPDSLTTWRLTARVVTPDTLVGQTVARTTTTKDLIVRVVTPRFLTEGDEVVVPTLVHNYLAGTKAVAVDVRATGVEASGGAPATPETLHVAQGSEQRIDRRFSAARPGQATFTSTATTDTDGDAVELSIPVLPFGLKQRTGIAGSIAGEGEGRGELLVPESANAAGRVIRVSLAPSLAGPMLGALDQLTSFPYGCTEQTLSSVIPNLVVLRALDQLKIAPTERLAALDRQVSEGLRRLDDYQHEDGGWGWWKTDENHPFMTAYAVYGLLEARAAGYAVDAWRITNGTRALHAMIAQYPRAVPDLKAYVAYVLALAATQTGEGAGSLAHRGVEGARQVTGQAWDVRDRMSSYGRALLVLALDALKDARGADAARALADAGQRKGDLAWWPVETDPLLEDWADTSVEATAFAVKALAARDPRHPLLEPAVRWLLLNRRGSWWSTTKQTAMALFGLLDYMRARREGGADAGVEVLVNGAPVGTRTFTPASLTAPDPVVLVASAAAGRNQVAVRKRGGGVIYWSATAEFYDRTGPFERTGSRKLAIVREYFSLSPVQQGKRIVYRETPFTGRAVPGDLLLVRVNVAGSPDWRYLVVEDPLPAGVETVRDVQSYTFEKPRQFWDGSAREYRDDRVVFFQTRFTEGHYEYLYLLKVTTPGVFRAMPAQVTAMYIPEARASSQPQTMTVASEAAK